MADQFPALVLTEDDGKVSSAVRDMGVDELPEGDVTVRVTYSGLNYKDGMIINGIGRLVRDYPHVPGIDFAEIGRADPQLLQIANEQDRASRNYPFIRIDINFRDHPVEGRYQLQVGYCGFGCCQLGFCILNSRFGHRDLIRIRPCSFEKSAPLTRL